MTIRIACPKCQADLTAPDKVAGTFGLCPECGLTFVVPVAANLTPPTKLDELKEAFSQACQMYRHFVNMRYYTFSICGAITAVICILYFQQVPTIRDEKAAQAAGRWISVCGVIVAFACGTFDWRLTDVMLYYQDRMGDYSSKLGIPDFSAFPHSRYWKAGLRVVSAIAYLMVVIAWIAFAKLPDGPPPPKSPSSPHVHPSQPSSSTAH
jgi:hypothetical protein